MKKSDFEGDFVNSSLLLKLRNGEQIQCATCNCGSCKNEFFVRNDSSDYIPNYCPYCGIKFIKGDQNE